MGDRAYTTLRAWPWPGEQRLPAKAREQLQVHDLAGIDQAPDRARGHAQLVSGDEDSGTILAIVAEEANYGTEAYRELIGALHAAGLNVYATNAAGGDYDALWEYHPAGAEPITRAMSEALGVSVISAGELLEECRAALPAARELGDVDDAALAAACRRLLAEPELPGAVLEAL